MDKQYSVKFFTSFVEAIQKLCREYLDFEQGVELSGYLAVEIDNFKKERYVLSELVQSTGNVISESYCTKAFKTLRKEIPPRISRDSENITPRKNNYSVIHKPHRPPKPAEVTIDLRDSPEREMPSSSPRYQHTPRGQSVASPMRWQNRTPTTPSPNRINNRFPSSYGTPPRMRSMEVVRSPRTSRSVNTGQPSNQIQPRRIEQTSLQSWTPPRITSVKSLRSPQHNAVVPSSPNQSVAASVPKKRTSESSDSVSSPSAKKDKLDENLEALIDLANMAKEISSEAQTETKTDNSVTETSTVTTAAVSASTTTASQNQQTSSSETVVTQNIISVSSSEVKKEQETNDPVLVIDNANEGEISSGSDSTFNINQCLESFTPLITTDSASFSTEQQSTPSTSFEGTAVQMDQSHTGIQNESLISKDVIKWSLETLKPVQKELFLCDSCGRSFINKSGLNSHWHSTHANKERYTCHICLSTFIQYASYQDHFNLHKNIRPYKCSKCGKAFFNKGPLTAHVKTCGTAISRP